LILINISQNRSSGNKKVFVPYFAIDPTAADARFKTHGWPVAEVSSCQPASLTAAAFQLKSSLAY